MSCWVAIISLSPPYLKMSEPQDNPFPKGLAAFSEKGLVSCVVITPRADIHPIKDNEKRLSILEFKLYLEEDPRDISK